jgi:MYXO-CTERM domain-containing protein
VIGTCNGANVCSICSVGSVGRPASGRDTTWLGLAVVFFLLRRQRARK